VVLGLDARGHVRWRDRAAYATLDTASCTASCPDGVLSGALEGEDSPERREPPVHWHVGAEASVDDHPGVTKYKVVAARSRRDFLAIEGDGVRYRLVAHYPGAAARRIMVEGPLDSSYEAEGSGRLLALVGSASESSDRLGYRWYRHGRGGWRLAGDAGHGSFVGACLNRAGTRAVLVGEGGARGVAFGSTRIDRQPGPGGAAGDCALGRDTLLSVLQRRSAAGGEEALLSLTQGGRPRWKVNLRGTLDQFAVATRRPEAAILTKGTLTIVGSGGRRRILRRGVADFVPDGDVLAVVTERGKLERVGYPAR
jgi:hypothetical protein